MCISIFPENQLLKFRLKSTGLFHRAIMMSASSVGQAVISTNQYDLAQKQARLVNCSDESAEAIVNCLKTKSAQEIADTLPEFAVNF